MNGEVSKLIRRLEEAGIGTRRFLKVDEFKAAYEDEWQKHLYTPEELEAQKCERWGINGSEPLVLLDADRIETEAKIRDALPPTFEVESPRRELRHFYVIIEGGKIENKTLHLKGETKGSGELRADNHYLVAPGTEIQYKDLRTGEDKIGIYKVVQDRPIARMQYADFMKAIEPLLGCDISQKITHQQMREGVDSGTRHAQGIKFANYLIGVQQFDRETAIHAIREWNKLNRPPMDDADLIRMVDDAIKYISGNPRPRKEFNEQIAKWFNEDSHKFKHVEFADSLMQHYKFITMQDDLTIYVYDESRGIYRRDGSRFIHHELTEELGEKVCKRYFTEIEFYIQGRTMKPRPEVELTKIACLNGIINVETGEIEPFTNVYFILTQIPIKYNPEAKCPKILKFLEECIGDKQILTMQEWLGYHLYQKMIYAKAAMFIGTGRNGKSTLIHLIEAFLGKENCCDVDLQNLNTNRFAIAQLYGKLACLHADIESEALYRTGKFKTITGGDRQNIENKFHDGYTGEISTKLTYSANKMPESKDNTDAYFSRWIFFTFPNIFTGKKRNPKIITTLTTPDELSGLLNWAFEGLKRLMTNEEFSTNEDIEESRIQCLRLSNSSEAYIKENLQADNDPKKWIPEADLYQKYAEYCQNETLIQMPKRDFTSTLKTLIPQVRQTKERIGKKATACYQYVNYIPNNNEEDNSEEEEKPKSVPSVPSSYIKSQIPEMCVLNNGLGTVGTVCPELTPPSSFCCPNCRAEGHDMFFVSDLDFQAHYKAFHESRGDGE